MDPIGKNLSEERTVEDKCLYNITSIFNLKTVKKARSKKGIYIYISFAVGG